MSKPSGVLEGFAGTVKGSFFEAPLWVDKTKAPGRTSQAAVYGDWWAILWGYCSLRYFFFSPNLVWCAVAATVYYVFPYDYDAAAKLDRRFCLQRLLVNTFVTFAYFGFWNISLYVWGWGTRKFNPKKNPTLARQFHNLFYSACGVLQWTVWEVLFVYAYATGRLGYVSDAEAFSGTFSYATARTFAAVLFVPLWRDFHFYFAHRFLHMRFLYKYVHSLHHRNTDIEPFSGLCMHPVEHLYYFSCVGPSLYMHATPFMMLWNGIHLLISPAASHSGYEDNFQSDQFHYLHHAQFECNYGTSGPPLDKLFGTFRERLGISSEYKGEAKAINQWEGGKEAANKFLSGDLRLNYMLPTSQQSVVYNGLAYGTFVLFCAATTGKVKVDPTFMAAALAFGPVVYGFFILILFGDKYSLLWPFHKEKIFGALGFHTVISFLMVLLPTYHFALTVLKAPGESVYFDVMKAFGDAPTPSGLAGLNVTRPDL